jgi:hypothetical protein
MASTKELRGKALRLLRDQIQVIRPGTHDGPADEQARYGQEFQTGLDAVVRTLENQIKQCAEHPEEPEPLKSDAAAEVRRLRGVLRQLAELPAARLSEASQLAMKALIEPPAQAPARRPSGGGGGRPNQGPEQRKFTPRRPEHRGRSNSGR